MALKVAFAAVALCVGVSHGLRLVSLRMSSVSINAVASDRLQSMSITGAAGSGDLKSSVKPIIIGSGPTGLATAIMLARRGYVGIQVFDKLPEPAPPGDSSYVSQLGERSYNIGLSGRGQRALKELDVMGTIENFSCDVVGRKDWAPGVAINEAKEMVYTGKSYTTKCIQRDRLSACLLMELRNKYSHAVQVRFDTNCDKIEFAGGEKDGEEERVRLFLSAATTSPSSTTPSTILESRFVIGADGAQSAVRDAMETEQEEKGWLGGGGSKSRRNKFFVRKYEDRNVRVYRTIPLHFPKEGAPSTSSVVAVAAAAAAAVASGGGGGGGGGGGSNKNSNNSWRKDLNYSARTKLDVNIDALPTKEGPYLGVVLYRPWDERMQKLKTAADARKFFEDVLPMFLPVLQEADLEKFAQKGDSKLPKFSFSGPVLHRGSSVALLGDAIHTVKPYFGLGVNSAFEDIMVLDKALTKHGDDLSKALPFYSKVRAKEARAMVQISRRLDGGFLSFVLPLIIDNILHRALPWFFSPNTLTSLQNENMSFTQVRLRKRIDRVLQVSLLLSFLAGAAFSLFSLARLFSSTLAQFSIASSSFTTQTKLVLATFGKLVASKVTGSRGLQSTF